MFTQQTSGALSGVTATVQARGKHCVVGIDIATPRQQR